MMCNVYAHRESTLYAKSPGQIGQESWSSWCHLRGQKRAHEAIAPAPLPHPEMPNDAKMMPRCFL